MQIRSNGEDTESCSGGRCVTTGSEVLRFDAYGNVEEQLTGNFASGHVVADDQRTRSVSTYENRLDGGWTIGLLTSQVASGYTEDVNGYPDANHTLSWRRWSYDAKGAVENATTRNVVPAACTSNATDDSVTYTYTSAGQLKTSKENQRRLIELVYDAQQLYVASQSVTFPQLIDGVATNSNVTLVEQAEHDLRNGQTIARVGLNGVRTTTLFDSQARMTEARGPNGVLLESRSYVDSHPTSITSTVVTDTGKSFTRKTHLDGVGRELGTVEQGTGTQTIRARRFVYDAFGRTVWVGLPSLKGQQPNRHPRIEGNKQCPRAGRRGCRMTRLPTRRRMVGSLRFNRGARRGSARFGTGTRGRPQWA